MKLLHIDTGQLHIFSDPPPVPYAILSYTWSSPAEDDWPKYTATSVISGHSYLHSIIGKLCHLARDQRYEYVWVDAACVNKLSSAEISEAINSRSRYFQGADVCLVFLEDLPCGPSLPSKETWARCRFWNRAWTLQDLVLPAKVQFYDAEWHSRGECAVHPLPSLISSITGVDENILTRERSFRDTSVARRMTWAAHRRGNRPEDVAYSLLGIFDVFIPVIYGEGGLQAFRRLQEEVLKQTNDMSLLAWTNPDVNRHRGIFATSPLNFVNFGVSAAARLPCNFNGFAALTSKGVLVEGQFSEHGLGLFLELGVQNDERRYGIVLRKRSDGMFQRADPSTLEYLPSDSRSATMRMMILREHFDTIGPNSSDGASPSSQTKEKPRNLPIFRHSLPVFLKKPTSISSCSEPNSNSGSASTLTALDDPLPLAEDSDWTEIQAETPRSGQLEDSDGADAYESMKTSQHTQSDQGWDSQSVISNAASMSSPLPTDTEGTWHACHQPTPERVTTQSDSDATRRLENSFPPYNNLLGAQSPQDVTARVAEKRMRREKRSKDRARQPTRNHKRRMNETSELSCPYYAKDPEKFVGCLIDHKLRCMDDVKEHLWAHHRLPFYCPTCNVDFRSAVERDEHIKARTCDLCPGLPFEGLSEDERSLISRIRETSSETSQWFKIWDICFPDLASERPDSAYLRGGLRSKVSSFKAFWQQHGRIIVMERLTKRFPKDATPGEAEINNLSSELLANTIRALAKQIDHQSPASSTYVQ